MNNTGNKEIIEISLEDIVPNRFQPRLTFDVEALNDLANSIKEHGIIQPLVVRRLQDKFEIIAGERRFKAATLIGMQKVPCIVMNLNDNESAEVAVIENIQRKEMTPLEEAKSFKKLLDKGYLTQEDLAKRMGKSQSNIANKLRLLNLDEVVQDAILNNKISERHARSLLKISDKNKQRQILSEILEKRLTVRQTDDLIKEKYEENNNIEESTTVSNQNINDEFQQKLSVPEVNIPVNNKDEINPQLNILQNLVTPKNNKEENNYTNFVPNNNSEQQNKFIQNFDENEQNIPSNINSLDNNTNANILNNFNTPINLAQDNFSNNKIENIDSILNPSVFSNSNPNINKPPVFEEEPKESVLVDINQIKKQAIDIRKEEKSPINIDSLLQPEVRKSENKFFVDLGDEEEILDIGNEYNNSNEVIESINRNLNQLKEQGKKIHKEEKDLGNAYQITIIIDK